jgi:hypothetical protein
MAHDGLGQKTRPQQRTYRVRSGLRLDPAAAKTSKAMVQMPCAGRWLRAKIVRGHDPRFFVFHSRRDSLRNINFENNNINCSYLTILFLPVNWFQATRPREAKYALRLKRPTRPDKVHSLSTISERLSLCPKTDTIH